ncbi:hypothetical protein [Massilia alkalitolerans]|uniref:hypothetical protein n=1 Tax=Massilia alkalitolerans TaxID=286638 RepID=UPI00041A8D95|nr:hypothetical protein [Massilia alkalitolerans]
MLSKAQTERIADELLEQARASRFGFPDPSGMPVAPLYQCRSMRRLPPGLQTEIVRKARLAVGSSPWFVLAVVAWIVAIALVYVFEPTVLGFRTVPSAFMILAPLAPLMLRELMVRGAARKIAEQMDPWPVPVRM